MPMAKKIKNKLKNFEKVETEEPCNKLKNQTSKLNILKSKLEYFFFYSGSNRY